MRIRTIVVLALLVGVFTSVFTLNRQMTIAERIEPAKAMAATLTPTPTATATATTTATPSATPTSTPGAMPSSPLYLKGQPMTPLHAPFTQLAAFTATSGAAASYQLPAVSGFITQLDYVWITCANPAATVATTLTIAGLRGQSAVLDVVENANVGTFMPIRGEQLPATSSATNITFTLASVGSGATCHVNIKYSFED